MLWLGKTAICKGHHLYVVFARLWLYLFFLELVCKSNFFPLLVLSSRQFDVSVQVLRLCLLDRNSDGNVIQDMPELTGYWLSDTGIG